MEYLKTLELQRIDTTTLAWKEATKTKPIFARSVHTIIQDVFLFDKMRVMTQEGLAPLRPNSMLCTGSTKLDPWQQTVSGLLEKYTVTDFTPDGWAYCEPKADNKVECSQINEYDKFEIVAKWGTEIDEGDLTPSRIFVQYGDKGDYICRNVADHTDNWIVKKNIFEATYKINAPQ